jgi:rod shape determining protein RodA
MYQRQSLSNTIDWATVGLYFALIIAGWLNIFAVVYTPDSTKEIWDISLNSGKQLIWIVGASILIFFMLLLDIKLYLSLPYISYGFTIFLLILVAIIGRDIQGSRSWFELGSFRFQPAEIAKFTTALALAKYLADPTRKMTKLDTLIPALAIVFTPALIIILQNETGTALVFAAFMIVLYRDGLSDYIMGFGLLTIVLFLVTLFLIPAKYVIYFSSTLTSLGVLLFLIQFLLPTVKKKNSKLTFYFLSCLFAASIIQGTGFFVNEILKPHQRRRIEVLVNPDIDPQGIGWQVTQSKIAIGSGGATGKGFLEGTQTKFDFVPDQSTDFIFCTIGEEHGWVGTSIIIILFVVLLFRLIALAERQKSKFSKIYGYCVVAILFFHFTINIGMTIGLFPVIGIPLPFFSYGGSALLSFTVLLFTMVKLDTYRRQSLSQ